VQKQVTSQQIGDQTTADAEAKKAIMEASAAYVGQLEAMQSFKQITAPFDGVVTARNTDIGALINSGSAGQPLFEVADLHRVRIYVQVPQAFTADLRPGLKATFEMPQYPGQKFDATLVTTSNAVNETSRSMLVELQADNPDGKLFGGTYCRVDFQIPGDPNMVRMPATALMPVNRGVQVAVVGDGNKVVLKSIQLGRDFGDTVEVKAGLSPQDRVMIAHPRHCKRVTRSRSRSPLLRRPRRRRGQRPHQQCNSLAFSVTPALQCWKHFLTTQYCAREPPIIDACNTADVLFGKVKIEITCIAR
jgi:RND family efflux transporter MFP subunit